MTAVLIAYATGEGQTAKTAEAIAETLGDADLDVAIRNVAVEPEVDLRTYDAVVVGSPVNNRAHLPAVVEWIDANRDALVDRLSAFFQLSIAGVSESDWAVDSTREWVDDLVEQTGWTPDRVGDFGGALAYSQYGPVERQLFRVAAAFATGDTDTSRDYEYTDWDEVAAFAEEFAALVAAPADEDVPRAFAYEPPSAAASGPSQNRLRQVAVVAIVALVVAAIVAALYRRCSGADREAAVPTE
ncbi:flavodoxin [Salinarchaeum sp. Harcht-Bsk1]|uniref:flavodoxin domain-containing protein n=1 Tax=Salinarchaeum sp. Harcht-Bsk1 TaxID=1333523 RepID=UPI0003424194|nr:flavodoxin domain-containing protein [Salinarchaeum sp. Harcht-Bsk1]AGN00353.1 flavodoxin [Salinarchaeum sp. Harcht-Bsk1]